MPSATQELHALLKRSAIFSDLSEQELGFAAAKLVVKNFGAGELIFSEGDPCSGMFIVQSGAVRIFKISAGGREQVLSIDGPGGSIAELPVFDGGPYPASAQAVQPSALLFFAKSDFHLLCRQYPDVALKVLRVIGGRLRRLVGIIEELSFTTVRHRLIALLVRLARDGGVQTKQGIRVTMPANNTELAAQIGTVRELVSRNLGRLQAEGLLAMDNREVVIPSLAKLENELQDAGA